MNVRTVLTVVASLAWASVASGQLVSERKSAEEAIEDYLLMADELTTSFCCRFTGVVSTTSADETYVSDIRGISAISAKKKASYYAFGQQSFVDPQPEGYQWNETLRIKDKVYDKRSRGKVKLLPNGWVDAKGERLAPTFPLIDPFGLALCTEGALVGDRSQIANLQQQFLTHDFVKSSVLDNGDLLARWALGGRKGAVEVTFEAKSNFMPIRTRYFTRKTKDSDLLSAFSDTVTQWKRMQKNIFVPVAIKMVERRPNKDKIENSFEFEWLSPAQWKAASLDFEKLALPEKQIWREPFLALFKQQTSRKR